MGGEPNSPKRRPGRFAWTGPVPSAAVVLLALFVYGDRPLVAWPWNWADDGLYLRQGEAVAHWLSGNSDKWLGPYDPVVLEKAPLFGLALGLLSLIHVPLRLAEFVGLLLAAFVFRAAIKPLTSLTGWRLAITILVLVGLPCLPSELRLLRSALQLALTSACSSAAVGLALRACADRTIQACWALLTGGLLGLAYLCREESIWLFPVVGGAALFATAAGLLNGRRWAIVAVPAGILLGFMIPVGLVQLLNFRDYGVALTTLRRDPSFTRAHQVLTSLEPDTRERFVPIRTATRLKAYSVSPTLARLEGYLEGEAGDLTARNELNLAINGRPRHAREFFVSSFEFVLKQAAYAAGARTPRKAERMFRAIADELEAAVHRGEIAAGSRGPALLAAPLPGDHWRILVGARRSLSLLLGQDDMGIPWRPASLGSPIDIQRMSDFTNTAVAPPPPGEIRSLDNIRRPTFRALKKLLGACYFLGLLTAGALILDIAVQRSRDPRDLAPAMAALVLLVGLAAYCLSMGVVDTLAYPILYGNTSYNSLGYAPLSVLAAYGLVVFFEAITLRRRAPRREAEDCPPADVPRAA